MAEANNIEPRGQTTARFRVWSGCGIAVALFVVALGDFRPSNSVLRPPRPVTTANIIPAVPPDVRIAQFVDRAERTSSPVLENLTRLSDSDSNNHTNAQNHPRTLYVVIGSLRGGEEAWRTLYSQVLDVNPNTDLALLIGDTRPELRNATIFERAKFYWKFPEFDDWGDPIDVMERSLKNYSDWRETILPVVRQHADSAGSMLGGVKTMERRGSGAVIFAIRWFLQLVVQRLDLLSYYDRFVVARSDFYYLCRHSFDEVVASGGDQPQDYLYLPTGEGYGGFTDRYLLVYRKNLLKAIDIFPHFFTHFQDYPDKGMNPERTLMQSWSLQGLVVQKFDRVFFTCGVPGDRTRWKPLGRWVPEGVQLKYEKEYEASYETCKMNMPDISE